MSSVAILGTEANETNPILVAAWRAAGIDCSLVAPHAASRCASYDAVLARLDVLPTLDGIEPGLLELLWLERGGLPVFNTARSLLATHDKRRTAAALEQARLPHPRTSHLPAGERPTVDPPVVLKPRFGSWGRDVRLCLTEAEIAAALEEFDDRPWYRRHGILIQEAVPSPGFDLRLLVAGGRVVGAIERHAAKGEWRTNISVGGSKNPVHPSRAAREVAVAAAAAVGADLVGVDLLPTQAGYMVIELNGAVDFDADYRQDGDVYAAIAAALGLSAKEETWPRPPLTMRRTAFERGPATV